MNESNEISALRESCVFHMCTLPCFASPLVSFSILILSFYFLSPLSFLPSSPFSSFAKSFCLLVVSVTLVSLFSCLFCFCVCRIPRPRRSFFLSTSASSISLLLSCSPLPFRALPLYPRSLSLLLPLLPLLLHCPHLSRPLLLLPHLPAPLPPLLLNLLLHLSASRCVVNLSVSRLAVESPSSQSSRKEQAEEGEECTVNFLLCSPSYPLSWCFVSPLSFCLL